MEVAYGPVEDFIVAMKLEALEPRVLLGELQYVETIDLDADFDRLIFLLGHVSRCLPAANRGEGKCRVREVHGGIARLKNGQHRHKFAMLQSVSG